MYQQKAKLRKFFSSAVRESFRYSKQTIENIDKSFRKKTKKKLKFMLVKLIILDEKSNDINNIR